MSSGERSARPGRRAFVAGGAALLLVAGCGFEPLYREGSSSQLLDGRIAIDPIAGREGFFLSQRLRRRLGTADEPAFALAVDAPVVTDTGLAVTRAASITRVNLVGTATFRLRRSDTRETVLEGSVRAVTSYSATGSPFATRTAARNARDRLAEALAERIADRVLIEARSVER